MGSVKRIRPVHNANLHSQGGAENWVNGIWETRRGPQLRLTSSRSSILITMCALLYVGPNVPGETYHSLLWVHIYRHPKHQWTWTYIWQRLNRTFRTRNHESWPVTGTHFNMFLTVVSSAEPVRAHPNIMEVLKSGEYTACADIWYL